MAAAWCLPCSVGGVCRPSVPAPLSNAGASPQCAKFSCCSPSAQPRSAVPLPLSNPLAPALLLIPQPKQVLLSGVNLRLTPGTRLAAQSVQEELRRAGFGPVIGGTWAVLGNIVGFSRALTRQNQRGLLQTTRAGYNSSEANLTHEKRQFAAFVLAADCAWNGGHLDPKRLPYDPDKVFDRLFYSAAVH